MTMEDLKINNSESNTNADVSQEFQSKVFFVKVQVDGT